MLENGNVGRNHGVVLTLDKAGHQQHPQRRRWPLIQRHPRAVYAPFHFFDIGELVYDKLAAEAWSICCKSTGFGSGELGDDHSVGVTKHFLARTVPLCLWHDVTAHCPAGRKTCTRISRYCTDARKQHVSKRDRITLRCFVYIKLTITQLYVQQMLLFC